MLLQFFLSHFSAFQSVLKYSKQFHLHIMCHRKANSILGDPEQSDLSNKHSHDVGKVCQFWIEVSHQTLAHRGYAPNLAH